MVANEPAAPMVAWAGFPAVSGKNVYGTALTTVVMLKKII
jgi:hypothetical protein